MHLESLKAKLKKTQNKNAPENDLAVNDPEESIASTSAVNLMQNVTSGKASGELVTINEELCNEEELNLMVSSPGFGKFQIIFKEKNI